MVALPQPINIADIPDDEFECITPGVYDAMITESEMKATKAGDGAYLELKVQIDGGRILFERLNLQNKNEKAVEIAYKTLKKICEAIGKTSIKDSAELHNKRFKVAVEVEKGKPYTKDGETKEGRDQNVIKKWLPVTADTKKEAGVTAASSGAPASNAALPPWKR